MLRPHEWIRLGGGRSKSPAERQAAQLQAMRRLGYMLLAVIAVLVAAAGVLLLRLGPASARGGADRPPNSQTAAAAIESARAYVAQGEPGKAGAVLSAAASEVPGDRELALEHGRFLATPGRPAAAHDEFVRALTLAPADAATQFEAGVLAAAAGGPERAGEHLAAAEGADPSNPEYALHLAQALLSLGRYDAAKPSLLRVIALNPDRAIAWGMLAEIELRENKANLALQHVADSRSRDPRVRAWHLIQAAALCRLGQGPTRV